MLGGPGQHEVEVGHRLHELRAVGFVSQSLVDFEEGNDVLHDPQVLGGVPTVDVAVHGVLEKDGAEDAIAVETRTGDDPSAHLVHEGEHLVIAGVGAFVNAVALERLRAAATALVKRSDEAVVAPKLLELLAVHEPAPLFVGARLATDVLVKSLTGAGR